jgi:hypothetical protein
MLAAFWFEAPQLLSNSLSLLTLLYWGRRRPRGWAAPISRRRRYWRHSKQTLQRGLTRSRDRPFWWYCFHESPIHIMLRDLMLMNKKTVAAAAKCLKTFAYSYLASERNSGPKFLARLKFQVNKIVRRSSSNWIIGNLSLMHFLIWVCR